MTTHTKKKSLTKHFLHHPFLNLTIGVLLIFTSLSEAWEHLGKDLSEGNFGAHHGVLLYAILIVLRTLPELVEGARLLFAEGGEE